MDVLVRVIMTRFRNICFTLFSFDEVDIDKVKEKFKYGIIGLEICPSTGKQHWQGYLEAFNPTTMGGVKKLLGSTVHIEKRMGTPEQAAEYCKKESVAHEWGTISKQGSRNDIKAFVAAIKEQKTDLELLDEHPIQAARYTKMINFTRMAVLNSDRAFQQVEVLVLWGDAGVGKTRKAHSIDPGLYWVQEGAQWWDGYIGQQTILMDDFDGGIKFTYLLKLLDGYRFRLPIKGGFTWKSWTRVIITSNKSPEEWYLRGVPANLKRRITTVTHMANPHSEESTLNAPAITLYTE